MYKLLIENEFNEYLQQLIIQNLEVHRKEAERLRNNSLGFPLDPQADRLLNGIHNRIDVLILRSQDSVNMIEVNFK